MSLRLVPFDVIDRTALAEAGEHAVGAARVPLERAGSLVVETRGSQSYHDLYRTDAEGRRSKTYVQADVGKAAHGVAQARALLAVAHPLAAELLSPLVARPS